MSNGLLKFIHENYEEAGRCNLIGWNYYGAIAGVGIIEI